MYRHSSTCLKGPITRSREWWYEAPLEDTAPAAARLRAPADRQAETGLRHDLVARVRQEIAAGTYDTPERWDAALARLLSRLEGR